MPRLREIISAIGGNLEPWRRSTAIDPESYEAYLARQKLGSIAPGAPMPENITRGQYEDLMRIKPPGPRSTSIVNPGGVVVDDVTGEIVFRNQERNRMFNTPGGLYDEGRGSVIPGTGKRFELPPPPKRDPVDVYRLLPGGGIETDHIPYDEFPDFAFEHGDQGWRRGKYKPPPVDKGQSTGTTPEEREKKMIVDDFMSLMGRGSGAARGENIISEALKEMGPIVAKRNFEQAKILADNYKEKYGSDYLLNQLKPWTDYYLKNGKGQNQKYMTKEQVREAWRSGKISKKEAVELLTEF